MAKTRIKPEKPLTFRQRLRAFKNFPRFFKLIWQTNQWMTLGNAFLRLLKSAIPVLMLYLGKLIVDEVVELTRQTTPDLSWLFTLIAIEFGLAIFSDLLNRGINLLDGLLGDLFANNSSVKLMEHAARLDLYHFEDSEFYDKLERARRQTVGRTVLMSQVLGQIQDLITMMFLAAGLIVFNPWLILLLIIAILPSFLGETHFNERNYSLVRGWTPERRELDYLRYTGASDETAKEVKLFGLSGFLVDRFRGLADKYYLANKKLAVKRAGWGVLFSAIGSAGYYAAYIFIAVQTVQGQISIGDLTFLSGSFLRLRNLLENMLTRFSSMAESMLYLQDFFEFFDIEPKIRSTGNNIIFPQPIQEGFMFENVSFKYENSSIWAVKDLSFKLQKGEKLALVGENGAGKTTLVKLLSRLYDPTEGRILLDGKDLKDYDPDDLRKQIGIIFQDFVKFQLKASENIAVGRIEEREDLVKIKDSANLSMADLVIEQLPLKYDQMIGRRFNQGVDLSGGQWQKIALGRAYMRNAQLLILDEPTAALDARAEHEVFQRFAQLTRGKTAVLISHRFSTVRMADRILVLENGGVREIGSHKQLLEKNGKYAELFRLQAKGYV
ncbi:MAG: ABC transporter ATP-binding protein [Candidatus Cyclobacteriaceae bacterium M3_2C_046]